MKKIMLIGSEGSIGRRYHGILRHLGVEVFTYDTKVGGSQFLEDYTMGACDGFIIASPTDTHVGWCYDLLRFKKPILCEKPVGVSVDQVRELYITDGALEHIYVVDNWVHMLGGDVSTNHYIEYANFHTGNEKVEWNLAQPIFLTKDGSLTINLCQAFFGVNVFDKKKSYNTRDIDLSYVDMIVAWLQTGKTTWDLLCGMKMQEAIAAWKENNP